MIDNILIDDLAVSPPSAWAKRIEQAVVIGPLARAVAVTAADQEDASARLGVGRRQFYNLLASYRERLKGASAHGHRNGARRRIDERKETVIAQAIEVAGAAARMRDVQALAAQLSAERGVERPSQTSIRTRFGRRPTEVDIVNRLKLDCDLVIDLCPLAISVIDDDDNVAMAWLLISIEPQTRRVWAHQIFAGQPRERQVRQFLSDSRSAGNCKWSGRKIGFTDHELIGFVSSLSRSKNQTQLTAASTSRKVLPGEVIRALFGSALGSIPIRSDPPKDVAQFGSPVDVAIVRAVVNKIAHRDPTAHG